jgi:hypothetical protein
MPRKLPAGQGPDSVVAVDFILVHLACAEHDSTPLTPVSSIMAAGD